MRVRRFLAYFVALALPAAALAGIGLSVGLRQLDRGHEVASTRTLEAVTALVDETTRVLRREALLLARDPALIEGTSRRDWATLARFAGPRMVAVTREGFADLLVVSDRGDVPLVQLPAGPAPVLPRAAESGEPIVAPRLVNNQPLFVTAAPIWSPSAEEASARERVGTVVMGRRVDRVAPLLERISSRPGLVFVAGDRLLASTRGGVPASGWAGATRSGRIEAGGEVFALRPVGVGGPSPDGALWALVPESRPDLGRRTLWTWFAALLAAGGAALAVAVWAWLRAPDHRPRAVVETTSPTPPPGMAATPSGDARSLGATVTALQHRLEAGRQIERHISEQLDLEQLLVIVAGEARRLIGGVFSVLYLRDGDILVPRAWSEMPDWVRDMRVPVGTGVAGTAVARGRDLIINDYANSPLALAPFDELSARLLAQPLMAGERALGAMLIARNDGEPPFVAEDAAALADFATQAAVAIENARLFAEAKRNAALYQALFEVGGVVGSTLDVERVLDLIVDRCRALMGVASAGITKLDPDTETLTYERGVGLSATFISEIRVRLGEGTTGKAVRDRVPVWSADIVNDADIVLTPELRDRVVREGYRAVLSVPVLGPGAPHGVLSVYWWEPHVPSHAEIALMSALADQAAIAIENARLYGAATDRGKRLATLGRLTETLTATLAVEDVLGRVVHSAVEMFGSSVARLWLVDEDERGLSLRAHAGPVATVVGVTRLAMGEGLIGRIVRDRVSLVVPDLPSDERVGKADVVQAEGTVSFAGVPLIVGDRVLGALSVALREARRFSDEDLSLLHSLGSHAAIAIENARLFAEEQRRKAYLTALLEVNTKIGALAPAEPLLQTIALEAARLLDVDNAGFRLLDGDDLVVAGLAGDARDIMLRPRIKAWESLSGRVMASGRAVICPIDEAPDLIPEHRVASVRLGYTTFMGIPLRVGERIIGVLSLHARRPFTAGDQEVAEAFAGQAAIVIENARLYAALDVRATRLRTLARLASVVSSSLDADVVLRAVATAAAEIMNSPFVTVYVADEPSRILERRAASDARLGAALPAKRRMFGDGLVGWVAERRQTLQIDDVLLEPRAKAVAWAREHGLSSFLGVPIIFQESLLGVLTLNDAAPRRLGDDDLSLLESFVGQAAVAIRNTRLYADTAKHLEDTRAMLEVAEILNSTLEPRRVLKQVAIKIAQVCQVDRCTIERWDGDRVIPVMSQFADGRRDSRLWNAFMNLPSYPPRDVLAHAQAIETRRPVIIPDTASTDLIPREWTEMFGHKSYMVVPLIRQDSVIGVMNLDYTARVTPFERWQVDRAMAIAGQLALTLENMRLYSEAQERLRETTTLLEVGRVLSQPGPAGEAMRRTAREVARAFGADMVGVYLLDERKEALVPAAGYHVPKHLLSLFSTRPFVLTRFPALTETWRAGRALWSADVKSDPRIDPDTFEGVDPHSVLFAPTTVRGEAVGALFLVWWQTGREFHPAEVRLIEGVASQVGLAMENAELVRQTQSKLDETERLLSVSRTLASTLDLETLPRHLLRHVARALGADSAGIWLLGEDGEWMEPVFGYHIPPEWLQQVRRLRLSIVEHRFYAEAAATRRPVATTDAMHDPRIPQVLRDAAPHRSQVFVPIILKDRMLGGFAASWWDAPHQLSSSDLRLMEAIAGQAGVALENARLFRDNQRRVRELSVLHELSRLVTGQLDQADLLDTIEQQLARLLEVRHIMVLLHDEAADELEVVLRVKDGVRRHDEPRYYPCNAAGLSGVVLATARPLRTEDYLSECRRHGVAPVPESVDLPHWLGAPMMAGNRRLGVLALRSRDRAFSESDQRLLGSIADLMALALRSARLYEERARAHSELAAAQDQLVRTEKLRAMGEMASGVAHDFNNVLAAVLGRAQLLLGRVDDPKLRQWIQVIERSALDGARTVRRLQDFTRIRRDHPAVPVDLNQVVQQTLEATESTWRQESQSRGIHFDVRTRLAAPLPMVSGDPSELREALTNLILNALDAMPSGGTLTLATRPQNGSVEIVVSDTGTGIPAGIRNKIFDPFFTTKGPKGTGLGLSMTYGILARHGGRIAVESEEGRGATFRLIFPAAADGGEAATVPEAPPAPAPPLKCLVVDDEEAVAAVLGDMLLVSGHEVKVVDNGKDALALFGTETFDLVLTDLAMPGMTGWEVARGIKDMAPAVRVVLVSGFGVEVSRDDMKAHGVDLVLAKPLRLQDIDRAVALARQR